MPSKFIENRREAQRRWREKDPIQKHFRSCKERARRDKVEFSLTKEDIVIPELCPILQTPLVINKPGTGKCHTFTPSVDRVDSSKGYTPDNIRIISLKANRMKGDMSIEDVERLLKYMKGEL